MSQIEKRFISDHDAQVIAGVGGAIVKTGVAAAALVAAGPVAAVGVTLASELTGVVLESQKQRLVSLARRFSKRTAELPTDVQERVREQLSTDAGSRIFETAWQQAAQEVDPEKLDFIAALLKNSLSSEVLREHQTRWLLKMLDELDTVQIVILQSFATQYKNDRNFRELHSGVFEDENHPEPPEFVFSRQYSKFVRGQGPQTEEEQALAERERTEYIKERDAYNATLPQKQEQYQLARERHALYRSRVHTLVERGLLGVVRKSGRFGAVDEVSEALTPLGAALLKIIDAVEHSEWGVGEQVNAVQAVQQSLVDIAENSRRELEEQVRALSR